MTAESYPAEERILKAAAVEGRGALALCDDEGNRRLLLLLLYRVSPFHRAHSDH